MLLYFILGIIFIYIAIPIIDSFLTIISTWAEYQNYKIAVKCIQLKKKYGIEVVDEQQQEQQSNPIGFIYTEAIGESTPPDSIQEEEQE